MQVIPDDTHHRLETCTSVATDVRVALTDRISPTWVELSPFSQGGFLNRNCYLNFKTPARQYLEMYATHCEYCIAILHVI